MIDVTDRSAVDAASGLDVYRVDDPEQSVVSLAYGYVARACQDFNSSNDELHIVACDFVLRSDDGGCFYKCQHNPGCR